MERDGFERSHGSGARHGSWSPLLEATTRRSGMETLGLEQPSVDEEIFAMTLPESKDRQRGQTGNAAARVQSRVDLTPGPRQTATRHLKRP